jgi:hypothetical protein
VGTMTANAVLADAADTPSKSIVVNIPMSHTLMLDMLLEF